MKLRGLPSYIVKLYSTLLGALILLSACATQPKAEQQVAPVHQPVYSHGYVTIHTIPEGAMISVSDLFTISNLAQGYSPLTVRVRLADGLVRDTLAIQATPTVPGQRTQRFLIEAQQQPGEYTISMYNTGPGAQ